MCEPYAHAGGFKPTRHTGRVFWTEPRRKAGGTVVKLLVLYGPPTDPAAFEEYYANTHLPLAGKIPNVARFEASRIVGTPDGGDPPYYRVAEVWFESQEALQASMSSPEGQETVADIPKFATGGATVLVGEVQ
jgi:uncharacterized protein (TIGR02118 family)